jgi:hypothetical protein
MLNIKHIELEVNINTKCTVVLKERGVMAINKHYSDRNLKPPKVKVYQVGDEYRGPLWDIMHVFGESCFMGPEPPFETTIILSA